MNDIDELIGNVAPFLGCRGRRKQGEEFHEWPDGEVYRYYSLREQLGIYGEAFQEQEPAAGMSELHRDTVESISSAVPTGERPGIGLIRHDPSKDEVWVKISIRKSNGRTVKTSIETSASRTPSRLSTTATRA